VKKVRLEAETGPNPGDGAGESRRSRGSLLHARNVPTFATSPTGAPRPPVSPRDVTSSPLFSAPATSRHRVFPASGTAWPGSCFTYSHVGEFRDICQERHWVRTRSSSRRCDAHRFVVARIARRASSADPCEFFAHAHAVSRSVIGAAPFFASMSVSSPDWLPDCRVRRVQAAVHVIQSPTYRVEKPVETRESKVCLSGVAVPVRDGTATTGGMADPLVGCILQCPGFSARAKGMAAIPAANRGFAAAKAVLP